MEAINATGKDNIQNNVIYEADIPHASLMSNVFGFIKRIIKME